MTWIGLAFALFAVAVWAVFMALPARLRGYWLLAASVAFFAFEGPAAIVLVFLMVAWCWGMGHAIGRVDGRRPTAPVEVCNTDRTETRITEELFHQSGRIVLALAVAGPLVLLAAGKYFDWGMGLLPALSRLGLHAPTWLAPLGMSYFVFRMVSYLADVAAKKIAPAGPLALAGYVLFFPTLPAGPIERFAAFHPQAMAGRTPGLGDLRIGATRIASGLFKKLVLSDFLLEMGKLLRDSDELPTVWVWIAMYAYTLHIYIDFSGYSDMAIGIARLFGIRIGENFNWPYLRTNIADFWRHWHITLTTFITEYIYYPLGGSRGGQVRAGVNTMIAMGLCGMWHGAGWHFIGWGLYHGAGLTIYRTWRKVRDARGWHRPQSKGRKLLAWFATFHFVALGWVIFFLPVREALAVWRALLGLTGG